MVWTTEDYLALVNDKAIRVQLSGWPRDVPYMDFSKLRNSGKVIKRLQMLWDDGILAWKPIPPDETVTTETVLVPLTLSRKPRAARRDIGATHKRWATRARHPRTGAKTPATVDSEPEPETVEPLETTVISVTGGGDNEV